MFYESNEAGGLQIFFSSPIKYRIKYCMSDPAEFDTAPTTDKDKVWRLTINRKFSSVTFLLIHCNNVLVLRRGISSSPKRCSQHDSERWDRVKEAIAFPGDDTASKFYRPYEPGNSFNNFKCDLVFIKLY